MTYRLVLLFEFLRLALRLMLLSFCVHLIRTATKSLRPTGGAAPTLPDELPFVTVQLPIRNEYHVAERLVRQACRLDYPRHRLEIQVLDDSDDPTTQRVSQIVEQLAAEGLPVALIHRDHPTGYKPGALNRGLQQARGDLVAIFDADCMPSPGFLRETVPYFADDNVGFVQVRWDYQNRSSSLLTRLQALVLDGLFTVDQHVRAAGGGPIQFNGTNGIWRRRCLDEIGPWQEDVLAEDVDLAFRAHLRGWKAVHRRECTVVTDLPEGIAAFRVQQRRWARGSAQALCGLFRPILAAPEPMGHKLAMFMHLGRHLVYPLILLTCITAPLTTLYHMPYLIDYGVAGNSALLVLVVVSLLIFYSIAERHAAQPASQALLIPLLIPLAMGMSLTYTVAYAQGLVRRGGKFVRTPKLSPTAEASPEGPRYRPPWDPLMLLELPFGLLHAFFAYKALHHHIFAYGAFFAAVSASFLWVSLASVPRAVTSTK